MIVLRVILIAITCYIFVWFLKETTRWVTIFFLLIFIIFQIASLIRYLNRVNRDLANFLMFLQEDNTTLAFSKKRIERNFGNIIFDLDKIIQKLHQAGIERVQQEYFIQAIVEQVNVGLIAFTHDGKIELANKTALTLFGIRKTDSISSLTNQYPELEEVFSHFNGDSRKVIKINRNGKITHLAIKYTLLKFSGQEISLVSFDDIRNELEAQEIEAWRKLIRILRHEIMNSITPILTLTTSIRRGFLNNDIPKSVETIEQENIQDTIESVKAIEDRSNSLIAFVEKFKSISNPPSLKIKSFSAYECFKRVELLFSETLNKKTIKFNINVSPKELTLNADEDLIEQVLINLLKNAIEAISHENGVIQFLAYQQSNKVFIKVIDNGSGIKPEYIDSIFIPSFTTKEHGVGIGLSLAKQIIQLHHGNIAAVSRDGETCFEINL